ncbi:MAG: hypothetical protein JSW39_11190 [Desulfobacterales bacterium]|nr:MAG: hypothetical protein JSW39_11190 [Desulfobacterales bacterium]
MFKKIAQKLFGGKASRPSPAGFFLNVRCDRCGEEFHLFVNTATDLIQNFKDDGTVTYSLKKEILGGQCRNLMQVQIEFDPAKKVLSRKIENGEFMED